MRKLSACLMAAMLSAAPVSSAIAGPADAPWGHKDRMETSQPRLGVMLMEVTSELRSHYGAPSDRGALVAKVMPDSTAAKAGIRVGDVLVAIRGEPVRDASDVLSALSSVKSGESIKIELVRDKKSMTLDATIGASTQADLTWLRKMFPWLDTLRVGAAPSSSSKST